MNQQTLEKAKELSGRIDNLKHIISKWEGSQKIRVGLFNHGRMVRESDFEDGNFREFKKKYLTELNERLKKCEHEFRIL